MDYLSRLYDREIKDFFEVAKIKMTGATKEGKKFGKFFKRTKQNAEESFFFFCS